MRQTAGRPQTTDFTQDVFGRYVCNGMDEALNSTDKNRNRPNGEPQSDARPFDIIVIGGGSFGGTLAQHLLFADKTNSHRILVLEAGSLVLPEHVQNLPVLGLNVPGPTTQDPFQLRNEVWGLPWRSDDRFGYTGLAYCLGGRSVFFGGWSPQLLNDEMRDDLWPNKVKTDLNTRYFAESAEQIGTDSANDFINGEMHRALRQQLFDGINGGQVTEAIPLDELPLTLKAYAKQPKPIRNLHKLEAPLAVQSQQVSGLFPVNKFSAIPLLVKAARTAAFDSAKGMPFVDDVKKRFMIVPHCHVIRLVTDVQGGTGRVTEVQTEVNQPVGCDAAQTQKTRVNIPVGDNAKVIIALGTIESTRLALLSFQGISNYDRIGKNMLAHLRSNLTIRIPRAALSGLDPHVKALQASALFVKGRHKHNGQYSFFHQQITAAGLDRPSTDSEAELFKKIPDIDTFDPMRRASDDRIVITIRGIGETEPHNPNSSITLTGETDEVGVRRAFVKIVPSDKDNVLWEAMDKMADEIAHVFANGHDFEVLLSDDKTFVKVTPADDLKAVLPYKFKGDGGRRDGMGTTHHEAGPLCMGDDPNTSVTNSDGRFHFVSNAYTIGPALFPTVGSPNPMLTGVALARRMGDHLKVADFTPDPGFKLLFAGSATDNWRMSTIKNQPNNNPGTFLLVDRSLESLPGNDLGLFYCTDPTPANFILKLEWLRWRDDDNAGVFLRFPDPNGKGYNNTAYVAINFGFEVQIDQLARDDGAAIHKTGAVYNFAAPTHVPARGAGEWNEFEIHANGQHYTVFLNGEKITEYDNPDPGRGLASAPGVPSFVGLQTHTGRVAFRKIQIKEIV
ncbi:MAG TPA: family 16 glycoside hydrolase [Pyrinomonadaceae bacterium]|jgi:choline dehydrogenase-like flavoprotein